MGRKKRRLRSRKKRVTKSKADGRGTNIEQRGIVEEEPQRKWLKPTLAVTACLSIIFAGLLWSNSSFVAQEKPPDVSPSPSPQPNVAVPKAAILDGLWRTQPNLTFTENLRGCLEGMGFRVDIFQGENVTINLLRSIKGYEIIVLRLHSCIHTDGFLYLFSGELYTESKYVEEQLSGAVRRGYTFIESEPPYFALNSVFLGRDAPEGLSDSLIILMGCNGTNDPYSIQRLLERKVEAYIAWNGFVDLSYSDAVTLRLVNVLSAGSSPKEAVQDVINKYGPDPHYGSILQCYTPG